jgi:hypothetical protein
LSTYRWSEWMPSLRACSIVLNRLRLGEGKVVLKGELVEAVYGDDPEGGPLRPEKYICWAVMSLRRHGFPIRTHYGWGYSYAPSFHEIPVNPSLTGTLAPTAATSAVGALSSLEQTPVTCGNSASPARPGPLVLAAGAEAHPFPSHGGQ